MKSTDKAKKKSSLKENGKIVQPVKDKKSKSVKKVKYAKKNSNFSVRSNTKKVFKDELLLDTDVKVIEPNDDLRNEEILDEPFINFYSDFDNFDNSLDDILSNAEISENTTMNFDVDDSIVSIKFPSKIDKHNKYEKFEELEKMINQDVVLSEDLLLSNNYNLKIKEGDIELNKSKEFRKKSKYIVNLQSKRININVTKENIVPVETVRFDVPRKRTISNISSWYFREFLNISSKSKIFKLFYVFGEGTVNFFAYCIKFFNFTIGLFVKLIFVILIKINNLGKSFINIFNFKDEKKIEKEVKVNSFEKIRDFVDNFDPMLLFKRKGLRNYARVSVFVAVSILCILSIRMLSFINSLDKVKGRVMGISEQAYSSFGDGLNSIMNSNFDEAKNNFSKANIKFSEAQNEVSNYNSILIEIAKFIPSEGKKLDSGIKLLNAGKLFSEAAEKISSQLYKSEDLSITEKIRLISINISDTKLKLKEAGNNISSVDESVLPEQYRAQFISIKAKLPLLIDNLDKIESLLNVSLDILGSDYTKRYLLLFQNDTEIRATGGFIGSIAIVDIKEGKIVNLEVPVGGPYDYKAGFFENIVSPEPLWLINPNFNFWDMNWWPNFPTSASMITKYFEKSGGSTVDGVIALNSSVMKTFLDITGPIQLENRNMEINSSNFYNEVQQTVEITDKGDKPKAIIGELMGKILDKVLNDKSLDYVKLLTLFKDSIDKKEVQMYFSDSSVEANIDSYGWSGSIVDSSKDYLNIVNTNIGGGKTDSSIRQHITHNVNILSNGTIIDTVKIKRVFSETDNIFAQTKNRNYIRIYTPIGSKLIEAYGFEGFPKSEYMQPIYGSYEDEEISKISGRISIDQISGTQIYNEFNKTVFAGWQELNMGDEKEINLRYELPFKINMEKNSSFSLSNLFSKKDETMSLDNYSVYYQKQSGASSQIESNFIFPKSFEVVWSNIEGNNFIKDFDRDMMVGFVFQK
ncbi:MAG: DUF4012 domain-containing protein [Patescibacteria group bacterium]|nr:DUF4012 domain-containing protein [Patescibacteria group bacterium]MDD4304439.1 DUF4012 domain-containing protein [Patescibacteria group bacterium]MDD4695462.1 DUF4012 domain-containing protein [Patescibacteria group bacterium]